MSQQKNTELLKKIAQGLKELRKKKGVSQQEVQDETGIHIARIETAKLNITITTLFALCKYFKVSLEDFFKGINL